MQRKWARSKMSGLGYYVRRGRGGKNSCIWCQECGQMDEVKLSPLGVALKVESHVCSRCGRNLEIKDWQPRWDKRNAVEHNFEFMIVTVCEGMQVVRMFNWYQYARMGNDTINDVFEVFQVWFDPNKGKKVIISKQYTRNWYYFRWDKDSEWKVKPNVETGGYTYYDVYSLMDRFLYPHTRILPILRRNGWKYKMFGMKTSPVDIWCGLLADPNIESLAKNGQYEIIDYWYRTGGHRKDKSWWMPIIKVCNRHHYIVKDASMWFDYIELLRYFNKDTRNPHYVCPENLRSEHDRLMNKKTRIEEGLELKRQIALAEEYEDQYRKHYGKFFGICFGNKNIIIKIIDSVKEMAEEGKMMHHCVYTMGYYDFKRHPFSIILSARDIDGNRLETVEISSKTWNVIQSRGVANGTTPFHDQIVELVEQNISLFKERQ